jgi:hypothetical protein
MESLRLEGRRHKRVSRFTVLVLFLAASCGAPPEAPLIDRRADDQRVLVAALRDLTTEAGDESPVAFRGAVRAPLQVSSELTTRAVTVEQILEGRDSEEWRAVSKSNGGRLVQAANDLILRISRREDFIPFHSDSSRLEIRRPTQARSDDMFDRSTTMWPPGYSADRQIAIVRMSIPWSVHECIGTFLLERRQDDWLVIARAFRYRL